MTQANRVRAWWVAAILLWSALIFYLVHEAARPAGTRPAGLRLECPAPNTGRHWVLCTGTFEDGVKEAVWCAGWPGLVCIKGDGSH